MSKIDYSEINLLVDKVRKEKETLAKKGSKLLQNIFKQIFIEYPELESFQWDQYIPSFNDGDPCVFSVCEPQIMLKGEEEHYDEYSGCHYDEDGDKVKVSPKVNKLRKQLYKEMWKLYEIMNGDFEDLLQKEYGVNVKVTVTRDGIDTEDCDYD